LISDTLNSIKNTEKSSFDKAKCLYYSTDTANWYDYGARFYDPQIGRFTTIDPLTQITSNITPYHYCLNNPVSNNDPTGMWTETATGYYTNDPNEIAAFSQQMGMGQGNKDPQEKEKNEKGKGEKAKEQTNDQVPWWQKKVGGPKDGEITQEDIDKFWEDHQDWNIVMGILGLLTPVPGDEGPFLTRAATQVDIVAANGIKVKGFAGHAVIRAIQRGVKPKAILDALKNPLKVGEIVIDNLGRASQRLIGRSAEVVINPETGRIISVNPTSSSKATKLLKQLGQ
jgi:RHS repeat-associated protein